MKNSIQIVILFLLNTFVTFSQNGVNFKFEVLNPNHAGKIFKNPNLAADKPLGSPYKQTIFTLAKVSNVDQKSLMRYNIYTDDFEFITPKKDTLILDKVEDFGVISFSETKKTYHLLSYTNAKNKLFYGYLMHCYEKNNFVLFIKENITYHEAKIAKTSMERSMPAKYVNSENTYYLKNKENTVTEFPDNKKSLIKLFPNKKEVIETFFKENKISFSDENDLKKIIDFIAEF